MNRTTITALVASGILASLSAGSLAQTESKIHLTESKKVRTSPWQINDGAGFRWDIYNNGMVNNGTNNAYSGGMKLSTGAGEFSGSSDSATISKDGREIELSPCNLGNSIRIWRRIYIEPGKNGYCRWIDVFENTSGENQNLQVDYRNSFGFSCDFIQTTGGKDEMTPKDWGLVTGNPEGQRSYVVQFFASSSSKIKPSVDVQKDNQTVSYSYSLELPPGKMAAVCIIHAQRKNQEEAVKLLSQLDLGIELAKVPDDLRKLIVNMSGGGMTVGSLSLPRDPNDDLLALRNGDQLKGVIVNKKFVMETFYGKVELPPEKVLGLRVPIEDENRVQLALTDGQILLGELSGGNITIRLPNGDELSPPFSGKNGLQAAAYSNKNRKADFVTVQPMVILRTGEQLFFNVADLDLTFKTEYGPLKLQPAELSELSANVPEGGLNKVVFANGSVLSGLIASDELRLGLVLGPTMTVRRGAIISIRVAGEPKRPEKTAEIALRNDDRLLGRITEESLAINTTAGTRRLKTAQIQSIQFTPGLLGQVNVKEHSGTIVSGTLENQTIKFKIEPGPELNVYIGHILNVTNPEPPPPPATAPASKPSDKDEADKKTGQVKPPGQPVPPSPLPPIPKQPRNTITPGPDPEETRPEPKPEPKLEPKLN
ncbi:MAG: hypothetical protein HZA50_05535 [Planctomycetes bacterium]|nr:hypothetical protein [Planctomycetota bacterium]